MDDLEVLLTELEELPEMDGVVVMDELASTDELAIVE